MIRETTFLLLASFTFLAGCVGTEADRKWGRARDRAEQDTPAFDPEYFKDPRRVHFAIHFDIVRGRLELSDRPAEKRPGPLPYRPPGTGSLTLTYRDRAGTELGSYALEDPALARSCDFENAGEGSRELLASGRIELLVPANPAIAIVEIGPVDGVPQRFDVADPVARATGG